MDSPIRNGFTALLCAFAILGSSWAQDPRRSGLTEKLDVRAVNLEVVVVDKDGNRVSGLGPEDFRLKVGKREMPIKYFSEIKDGVALDISDRSDVAGAPAAPEGATVPTHYLVFIDDVFSFPFDRDLVLERLEEQFKNLGPDDQVAMVSYNGRRTRMHGDWTGPDGLKAMFAQARETGATGLAGQVQLRTLLAAGTRRNPEAAIVGTPRADGLDALPAPGVPISPNSIQGADGQFVGQLFERELRNMAMAMNSTLRSFAEPTGRKVALLLSGGWPSAPNRTFGGSLGAPSGLLAMSSVCDTANLLGFTLYPIDVPGRRATNVGAEQRTIIGAVSEFATHETLGVMAERTGGRALLDTARLAPGSKVIEDTRSYYWLGFRPDRKGNDKQHKVRIEVLKPGLKVRARRDYKDRSRDTEMTMATEGALVFDRVPGSKPLEVRLGTPKVTKKRTRVPAELVIPMDDVVMLPARGGYAAKLELRVAVEDDRGDRNSIDPIPVVLSGKALPQPGQHAIYEVQLELRARPQRLVLTLHDPAGDTLLVARTNVK